MRVGMTDAHQEVDGRGVMAVICLPRRSSRSPSRQSSGTGGRQRGPCWSGRTSRSRHPPWRPASRRERKRFESGSRHSMRRYGYLFSDLAAGDAPWPVATVFYGVSVSELQHGRRTRLCCWEFRSVRSGTWC